MIRKILTICACALIFVLLLGAGGYTIYSFKDQVILKDPIETVSPAFENIPDIQANFVNPFEKFNGNNEQIQNATIFEKDYRNFKKKDMTTRLVVIVDDQEFEINENTLLGALTSINNIYHDGSNISYRTDDLSNEKIVYTKYPTNIEQLVATLNIVNTIENNEDFNIEEFTQPEKLYKLDKVELNTFDYSLYTSPNLKQNEPLIYKCPLTGNTITDKSQLKYNYIIPLESVYNRGGKDWGVNEKNEYGTSLLTGVCTDLSVNIENKSLMEYMPDINKGDYCYTWLVLCSYYELDITSEELNQCLRTITSESQFLGGIEQ